MPLSWGWGEDRVFLICYAAAAGCAVLAWVWSGQDVVWGAELVLLNVVLSVLMTFVPLGGRYLSPRYVATRSAWAMIMVTMSCTHIAAYVGLLILIASDYAFRKTIRDIRFRSSLYQRR